MTPDPSAPPGEPRWICRGFDGEGCPVTVDWTDVEWLPLGTFGDIRLAEVNAHAAVDLAPGEVTTLAELFGRPRFHCPRCGAASSSADDIAAGYCGACHDWTGRPAE
jgi:ribosomal protein S27AE